MPDPLRLQMTDYQDLTRWRWVLQDDQGRFLADHEGRLDPATRPYRGYLDLADYLDYLEPIYTPEAQLADLGAWIGAEVFGGLRDALRAHCIPPATAVQVTVPQAARDLLLRPLELARFPEGTPFWQAGVRFVYHLQGAPDPGAKAPATQSVRLLAAFSLPVRANPLNLRRERYGLQRLVRRLNQVRGLAVELRVLQYGATRATLREALEEAEGWDVIHLSGHGTKGTLQIEDERGEADEIGADELGKLLDLARGRLKLLILDACYSGAGSQAAARAQVGLDRVPVREEGAGEAEGDEVEGEAVRESDQTALPNLGQALSERLDCAALAMRYPVGDAFATELMLALYGKLLERRQPLPGALHLALGEALQADVPRPALSLATPVLLGTRAAELKLAPPQRPPQGFDLPQIGLGIAFPPEPERFVGRLQPMRRAHQALAPGSEQRGVLFYGMPGAGKTACALELAYRHAEDRFAGYVWYQAPPVGSDVSGELYNVLFEIEAQLNAPELGLTAVLNEPERFRRLTLPRLRAFLEQNALLLVLDNLETLLSESNRWRDPLWGELVEVLLDHNGPSRAVLTSRRLPAGLAGQGRLQVEAIHALSFAETVVLARELPHLKRLFDDEEGQALLRQTLRVVQGHPKLLELADGLAAEREALAERVEAAEDELGARAAVLDAFFAAEGEGETRQGDADFIRALQGWTAAVAGGLTPTAGLLFGFLCRLEPPDRRRDIVEKVWPPFLERLGEGHPAAAAVNAKEKEGLAAALEALQGAGLVAALEALQGAGLLAAEEAQTGLTEVLEAMAQQPGLAALLAGMAGEEGQEGEPDLGAVQALLAALPAALPAAWPGLAAGAATYTIHPGVAESACAAADRAALDAVDVEMGDFHLAMFLQSLEREMRGGGGAVVASARRAVPYLLRQTRWVEASTLLEQMIARDPSPEALAYALPRLRRIAEATVGTERELTDAGVLAAVLSDAGRVDEAERIMRDVIARSVARDDYRLASVAAGYLLNLLMAGGRLAEALEVAGEKAAHTRRAGLGPWTQLSDEVYRLQILNAMGRYDEVTEAVQALRARMEALPEESEAEETVVPWNVREALLYTGSEAALRSERWEEALALNAEIVRWTEARGADALEVARTRYNDHGPLLRLGRINEARALLLECRAVFEAERAVLELGGVYSALADLEDETGGRDEAVRFEEIALRFRYQAGQPEDCAISHHNLAIGLGRQGADPAAVLAHRLAAAVIFFQAQSGHVLTVVRNLARTDLPPVLPSFADVVAQVESVEGVRFQALFERLPRTAPDGDAALAAVWRLVEEEQRRREQQPAGPDIEQVLGEFAPLLEAIAGAAADAGLRSPIEPVLARMQQNGWMLVDPVQRIWAGERDAAALTAGLDAQDSALIRRVLELIGD